MYLEVLKQEERFGLGFLESERQRERFDYRFQQL